jgi:hypothetical protein
VRAVVSHAGLGAGVPEKNTRGMGSRGGRERRAPPGPGSERALTGAPGRDGDQAAVQAGMPLGAAPVPWKPNSVVPPGLSRPL